MAGPQTTIHWRALATLLGGVALGVLHVTDLRAASFTVTRTDDTERGACNPGDCSLREAIEAANALAPETSTITLPAGTYGLTIAQRLSMSADITITGAGSAATIVDGNQLVGVFDIIGTDEIDGITVRNGLDASGAGGGGIHNGGTFTGTDLALDGNTTNGPGGGLFNEGTAYLIQGMLRNNMAAEGGGFSNTGFISVLGSFTIDGNTSTAEGGGVRNDGFVSLDNTNPPVPPAPPTGGGTISANHSGTSGGGIYNTGLISLMNVALDGNRAAADGGALWNAGSLDAVNGTISRSAAGGNGAGFWNDGTTTLTNATLANNSTVAGMGGAVWNDGVLLLDSGTVAGNGASAGGGTSNNASGTVEVRNTILAANTPDNCSGGIISDGNNIDRCRRRLPAAEHGRSREDCGNCVDDDGDGRTDYEDPACCAQTAAMQVKKALIVPGPAGAMKGNLSLIAILAQAGFADVDPTRDDVTVQFRNQNGELLCANIAHQRWKHGSRRGPFQFGDPTGTVAQGLRKMQIKVSKSGSARFLTAGKKMDLGRYARPELTATVRVGDRCSTASIALRNRGNKKFVFP